MTQGKDGRFGIHGDHLCSYGLITTAETNPDGGELSKLFFTTKEPGAQHRCLTQSTMKTDCALHIKTLMRRTMPL